MEDLKSMKLKESKELKELKEKDPEKKFRITIIILSIIIVALLIGFLLFARHEDKTGYFAVSTTEENVYLEMKSAFEEDVNEFNSLIDNDKLRDELNLKNLSEDFSEYNELYVIEGDAEFTNITNEIEKLSPIIDDIAMQLDSKNMDEIEILIEGFYEHVNEIILMMEEYENEKNA